MSKLLVKGLKAFILQVGLPDRIENADTVLEDIQHDRFDFVDHEDRIIHVQAWAGLVTPGSIVQIKLHNASQQKILQSYSDKVERPPQVDMTKEDNDQHASVTSSSDSTASSTNDSESMEGQDE